MNDDERREAERLGDLWSFSETEKIFRLDHTKAYVAGYAAACESKNEKLKFKYHQWGLCDQDLKKERARSAKLIADLLDAVGTTEGSIIEGSPLHAKIKEYEAGT